mmetsp:Transcript_7660/g.13423  ORF Transcript_7660/g.13423 Transcript_7660/m.13423 type:complete len:261 (-) Transcript_7660:973-1755(-)
MLKVTRLRVPLLKTVMKLRRRTSGTVSSRRRKPKNVPRVCLETRSVTRSAKGSLRVTPHALNLVSDQDHTRLAQDAAIWMMNKALVPHSLVCFRAEEALGKTMYREIFLDHSREGSPLLLEYSPDRNLVIETKFERGKWTVSVLQWHLAEGVSAMNNVSNATWTVNVLRWHLEVDDVTVSATVIGGMTAATANDLAVQADAGPPVTNFQDLTTPKAPLSSKSWQTWVTGEVTMRMTTPQSRRRKQRNLPRKKSNSSLLVW